MAVSRFWIAAIIATPGITRRSPRLLVSGHWLSPPFELKSQSVVVTEVRFVRTKLFNAISLFSGAGALDLGFHNTGNIRTLACYEYEEDCCRTLELNRSKLRTGGRRSGYPRVVRADLSDRGVIDSISRLGVEIDVVYGGPPCQSFSIMGKKGGIRDSRGALIFSFLDSVSRLRPKVFLFENVPHFSTINRGRVARGILRDFEQEGYSLWSGILNAADFGALTFRRRFFILGVEGDSTVPPPRPTHTNSSQAGRFESEGLDPWRTCERVFVEIETAEKTGRALPNHELVNHTPATIERFRNLAFGETDNVRKRNRLDPDRPAHSIYVGGNPGKLQARTHIHPYLPREITARECALIQGLPLDWEFSGRRDSAVLQAANAVPVPLAHALASHLISLLENSGDERDERDERDEYTGIL